MLNLQGLLLATCCFAPLVVGVIHNLERLKEDELAQPLAVDISPDEHLGDLVEGLLEPDYFPYRNERQAERGSGEPPTDIGTVTRLDGTNRHYFALVHWTGHPSEVVFIVTMSRRNNPSDSCLWRSTDYGKTFSNDTYKLNDSNVVINWYFVSPMDNNLVMVDARQEKIFATRDEGVSYVGYDLEFKPDVIRFQGRGVPNVMEGNIPEHIVGYDRARQALYVSPNLGETWTFLGNNVSRFTWRTLDEEYESNSSLYYERDVNETHGYLMVTEDPYDEHREFDPNLGPIALNSTMFAREYILVQRPVNWTEQEEYSSPLWVSTFRRPFKQANFPFEYQQDHFAVMDSSENQVFLAVEHSDDATVHLFTSDAEGVNYTFSLDDVVASEDWGSGSPSFDIDAVQGVRGTFLVNHYNRPDNETEGDVTVSTLISYNKGAQWTLLNPPYDSVNNFLCQLPQCSLHLRMDTDRALRYSSILSKYSAVGMIIAQGNVGTNLVNNDSLLHVFISRDGGYSWRETHDGHWSFQMIALGSIIVMIPKRATLDPVDYVEWSCDEGNTWTRYIFTTTPMRLIGMLPEKGERARRVTIFGYLPRVRPFAWLIVELDFSDAVPTQCTYPDDYFIWTPSDDRSYRRCVLGAEMTFERRNSSVCCYIDPSYERSVSNVSCPCTRDDYVCDSGYEQLYPDGPCEPTDPVTPPDTCTEGASYITPSGYRKIVDNVCVDQPGSPFLPATVPCPPVAPGGLDISTSEDFTETGIIPGQSVTFILTQETGWTNQTMYTWTFGDSSSSVFGRGFGFFQQVTHAYSSSGSYIVTVRAANSAGSESATLLVHVSEVAPNGLSIRISEDTFTDNGYKANQTLTFILTQEQGWTLYTTYTWDFGDSTIVSGVGLVDYGSVLHSYARDGRYVVTATAANIRGNSSTSINVPIGDLAPGTLNITITGDTSTAGNSLVFTLTQEKGLTDDTLYTWDFGDGVNVSGVGLQDYGVQTHSYDKEGTYTVVVTASNENGASTVSLTISIGDLAPGTLNITITGDTSKAGNSLVFTLTQEKGLMDDTLYMWDFGDGVNVSGVGLQDYGVQTHSYDKEGTYTVVVTASNENGASTVSLTISIGDLAPGTLNITITGDTSKAGNSLVFTLTQEKVLPQCVCYN